MSRTNLIFEAHCNIVHARERLAQVQGMRDAADLVREWAGNAYAAGKDAEASSLRNIANCLEVEANDARKDAELDGGREGEESYLRHGESAYKFFSRLVHHEKVFDLLDEEHRLLECEGVRGGSQDIRCRDDSGLPAERWCDDCCEADAASKGVR